MVEIGTYEGLIATSSSFRCLLENIHQQEEQEQEQMEPEANIQRRRSTGCVTFSEKENEDGLLIDSSNFETKEEGSVKWPVYIAYLRAGAGLFFGVLLLILVFGFREVASIFYSWWLAKWSADEGYRHHQLNNCTKIMNEQIKTIRSMNDIEWEKYRNSRFYFYCG
jgi:hypothetical protein